MKKINAFIAIIAACTDKLARLICIITCSLLTVDVVVEVLMRYVFFKPMVWGEQVACYLMIWMAMVAGSMALRVGGHMNLDIIQKKTPAKVAKIFVFVSNILVLAFLIIMTKYGFKHALGVRMQRSQVVFNISMMWPYLAIPVGGVMMIIQHIDVMFNGIKSE